MKKKLKALIEAREAALGKIDALLTKAETERRELTADEQKQHDEVTAEIRGLDTKIKSTKDAIALRESQDALNTEARGLNVEEPKPRTIAGDVNTWLSVGEQRDLNKYSLVRAINARLEGNNLDGIEKEMHDEGMKEQRECGVQRSSGNLIVPQIVLERSFTVMPQRRDLTATGTTAVTGDQGGMTIQTSVGSMIDRLRNALVLNRLGVTMLTGLQGNIDFPKLVADDQAVEKAENATSAESSVTFSKVSISPRRLPIFAEVSRQLLMQSSVAVEGMLRNDLMFQAAQRMENMAFNGNGSSQPYGILNTVGVGAVSIGTNGGAPTWDTIVDLETAIAALNADVGSMSYVTNAKVRGKLKRTSIEASTNAEKIWSNLGGATPLNGYGCPITNLIPSNLTKNSGTSLSAMVFGQWADALHAQWGGMEMLVNPYSKDTEGLIRINLWTFYDFIVRRVESFAVCKDIATV